MSVSKLKVGAALLCIPAVMIISGCAAHCKASTYRTSAAPYKKATTVSMTNPDLPPNARVGECYAKVFIPEQFDTRKETVLVRDASERLEIVPAQYEWVEETVLVKEASCRLEEVPAQFEWREQTIQTDPGHTGWKMEKTARCVSDTPNNRLADEMYCLESHPPVYKTIKTQVQVKPATVREVEIPAEYQTVRRQRLAAPATTRRIAIPAEFASVEKTFKVSDSRVEWQLVDCDSAFHTDKFKQSTGTLTSYPYTPNP
jgi:hypothetical protein